MLFEVSNQFWIAISFVWLGVLIACISEFILIESNKKWLKIITDFIFWTFSIIVFFVWITKFGQTKIRFYYIICFFIGFILEKTFWHKTIANYKKMIYNKLRQKFNAHKLRIKKRLKRTNFDRFKKNKNRRITK